jgi:hypothetical protein
MQKGKFKRNEKRGKKKEERGKEKEEIWSKRVKRCKINVK